VRNTLALNVDKVRPNQATAPLRTRAHSKRARELALKRVGSKNEFVDGAGQCQRLELTSGVIFHEAKTHYPSDALGDRWRIRARKMIRLPRKRAVR
jgi:hypothetical protein